MGRLATITRAAAAGAFSIKRTRTDRGGDLISVNIDDQTVVERTAFFYLKRYIPPVPAANRA